jgi:hypothetical protein
VSQPSGLWIGEVAGVSDEGVMVTIDALDPAYEWGPCPIVEGVWTKDLRTSLGTLTADGDPSHDHGPHDHKMTAKPPLAAGDAVLLGQIGGYPDRWVVLGRLESPPAV